MAITLFAEHASAHGNGSDHRTTAAPKQATAAHALAGGATPQRPFGRVDTARAGSAELRRGFAPGTARKGKLSPGRETTTYG